MDYKTLTTMYTYAQLYLEKRIAAASCKESRKEYKEEMEEITDLFMELNKNKSKSSRKKLNDNNSVARPRERYSNGKIKRYVQR